MIEWKLLVTHLVPLLQPKKIIVSTVAIRIFSKFRDYFYYAEDFPVYSDNKSLSCVVTSSKFNDSGTRWVLELSNYNFPIKYQPGKVSLDCDYFLVRRSKVLKTLSRKLIFLVFQQLLALYRLVVTIGWLFYQAPLTFYITLILKTTISEIR